MLSKVFRPAIRSPEVGGDGSLIFQVEAPAARQVRVELDALAAPLPLDRAADGIWRGSSPALPPDLYCYRLVIDGVSVLDPANPWIKPSSTGLGESMVLLPGRPDAVALPWQHGDVPRGLVARHSYRSAGMGGDREFYVYTPPGYDRRSGRTYPVLYLLHGLGDAAGAWFSAGRADVMLDALIHDGRCRPMLVVCPSGHCDPGMASDLPPPSAGVALRNIELSGASLLDEVLPVVERSYSVDADRRGRAVGGLSMGGAQALFVGLNAPHRFAHVGAFSPATFMFEGDFEACLRQAPSPTAMPRLSVSCGRDDFLIDDVRGFVDWLAARGVAHTWQVVDGAHAWPVWRRNFIDFVGTLFNKDHHDDSLCNSGA